jgi:putative oxidoreductase
LRRLFSTFARGAPGLGLLLLRLVGGFSAIAHGLMRLRAEPSAGDIALDVLTMAAGALLLAGLWTPIAGSLAAALALWSFVSNQALDPWAILLCGGIGVALALLGPGVWSFDARLFGWKRIEVGERKG